MSIDTTFKPLQPTVAVTTVAVQAVPAGASSDGVTSFRVHNNAGTKQIFGWGISAIAATAAITGLPGTMFTFEIGEVVYLELPYNVWMIGNAASAFEVTPGMGGVGG